jgi:hypothetical protein
VVAQRRRPDTDTDVDTDLDLDGAVGTSPRTRAQSRAERLARREEIRRQQKAASFRRKWGLWLALGLLTVLALAALMFTTVIPRAQALEGLERYSGLSREHVPGEPAYDPIPPVGGPHSPQWQRCGVYGEPIGTSNGVHSLEHGAVWITYRPDLAEAEVQTLRGLARGQRYVLISPWAADPALPSPIVASAWGLQLKADSASDSRLGEFVRRYANGPQNQEPGSNCDTGVGTPLANP